MSQGRTVEQLIDDFQVIACPEDSNSEQIKWLDLDIGRKKALTLEFLSTKPALWIIDGFDSIASFGSKDQHWHDAQRKELADIVKHLSRTGTKVLITSRDKDALAVSDVTSLMLPRMSREEQVSLARTIAARHDADIGDLNSWIPLFTFAQGNPLVITLTFCYALEKQLHSTADIEHFANQLEQSRAAFPNQLQGITDYLQTSFASALEHGFTHAEHDRLTLLYLFQEFACSSQLWALGQTDSMVDSTVRVDAIADTSLRDVRHLLDRAASFGMLQSVGGDWYSIHPAVRLCLKERFQLRYGSASSEQKQITDPEKSWAGVMAGWTNLKLHAAHSNTGSSELTLQITNMRTALAIARKAHFWNAAIVLLNGLESIYTLAGRWAEWQEIVDDTFEFVRKEKAADESELPVHLFSHKSKLAYMSHRFEDAEQYERKAVSYYRQKAKRILKEITAKPDSPYPINALANRLLMLGDIQRKRGKISCEKTLQEAAELAEKIGDAKVAIAAKASLEAAHTSIPGLRRSRETSVISAPASADSLIRGRELNTLGQMECFQWEQAARNGDSNAARQHLKNAVSYHKKALQRLPQEAPNDLGIAHHHLGSLCSISGDMDAAVEHWRAAISYYEQAQNSFSAARSRASIASALAKQGRFRDALDYAQSAKRIFDASGAGGTAMRSETERLIREIRLYGGL